MIVHSLEVNWLVLALHGGRVKAVSTVHKLYDVIGGTADREVIVRAQIF